MHSFYIVFVLLVIREITFLENYGIDEVEKGSNN